MSILNETSFKFMLFAISEQGSEQQANTLATARQPRPGTLGSTAVFDHEATTGNLI